MSAICATETEFKIVSGMLALLAAGVWLAAWWVKSPPPVSVDQMRQTHGDIITPIANLMGALARQSALNGWAALLAALAALFQVALAFMPTC